MATVALTFDEPTRPAVDVAVTGLPTVNAIAVPDLTAIVQRSSDGVIYRTIRGGAEAPISAGAIATLRDWEYGAGTVNTYRAGVNQWVDTFTRTAGPGVWGTSEVGTAWTAATGSAAATASVSSGRAHIEPASADQGAKVALARSVSDVDASVTLRPSAVATGGSFLQDFAVRVVDADNQYYVRVTWQTGAAATLALYSNVSGSGVEVASALMDWSYSGATDYRLRLRMRGYTLSAKLWPIADPEPTGWGVTWTDPDESIASGDIYLQGYRGVGNTNVGLDIAWDDLIIDSESPVFLDSDTITPTVSVIYLKSTARSFLNLAPMVVDYEEPSRESRGGETEIVGRSSPIAQTELMGPRVLDLVLRVASVAEARTLEYVLAAGDVMFLHVPPACPIPGGYYRVLSQGGRRVIPRGQARLWTLPLRGCAAPGPDIVTVQATWDSVVTQYGSDDAVMAAFTTWEDLLENLVGDPSEVIVE